MKLGWAVVWRGKNCVAFWKDADAWSLDPDEAHVFSSWVKARYAAGIQTGVAVVRCWT